MGALSQLLADHRIAVTHHQQTTSAEADARNDLAKSWERVEACLHLPPNYRISRSGLQDRFVNVHNRRNQRVMIVSDAGVSMTPPIGNYLPVAVVRAALTLYDHLQENEDA